jgi:hypothetical protein
VMPVDGARGVRHQMSSEKDGDGVWKKLNGPLARAERQRGVEEEGLMPMNAGRPATRRSVPDGPEPASTRRLPP